MTVEQSGLMVCRPSIVSGRTIRVARSVAPLVVAVDDRGSDGRGWAIEDDGGC